MDPKKVTPDIMGRASQGSKVLRNPNEPVNLSIKVTLAQRLHWLIEAKRNGTSLTEAIVEALNDRFGSVDPDD
jgi:hypothetical protein